MGDYFQTIVDLDATTADASELAARALDWLVGEEIVRAERTDCVLGSPLGHPPAGQWTKAATDPGWEPTDGLGIETGRRVFFGGQGGAQYVSCPRCGGRTWFHTEDWEPVEGTWAAFGDAIEEWHASGDANVTCPSCAQASELTRWRWADDYFAFGYLGFEFWNWPEFDPRFIADFSRALNDHQVVRVWGKL
jgi:hypothetical protein